MNAAGGDEICTTRCDELAQLIANRLESEKEHLQQQLATTSTDVGVRHCGLDNLLASGIAKEIYEAFPSPTEVRLMNSFRERKYTSKNLDKFNPLMADITFAVQALAVLALVQQITGIQNPIHDLSLYAGGLSAMGYGHFLVPPAHISGHWTLYPEG
jgi:Rps23 Pro-64 3,4-dihydroxylase Tpa1-like proline 4-hydroxylase